MATALGAWLEADPVAAEDVVRIVWFEHLAGVVARQRVHGVERAGVLERREAIADPAAQGFEVEGRLEHRVGFRLQRAVTGPAMQVIGAVGGAISRILRRDSVVSPTSVRLLYIQRSLDHSKATRELGWKPAETFATGIEKTVDWYLTHRSWTADITAKKYSRERLGTKV